MADPVDMDDRHRKAIIGDLQPIKSTIAIVSYDAAWPLLFEQESARIRTALGDRALEIEHVGSTSVPGLAAKPVIDILLVLANSAVETEYVPDLEAAGYILRVREPDWWEHRMFKGSAIASNIHCFSSGCPEIQRMLTFRNWLRTSNDDRILYERTKKELAARTWKYLQNYADAKSGIVEEILKRANEA